MYQDNHVLTKEEISQYQKSGYSLSDDKMYIIKFLFNDKQNEAVDPRPFRIKTSLIKKLANDAIDMPYVVNPNDTTKHLRGTTEGKKDTAKDLLEIQAKYAIGLIRVPLITSSNNVYGIIEVWKEYEKMILEDKLPKATSPTLFVIKEDADGIEDAQFLNINGVEIGGYPEILSGTHGVCKGGIKQCMQELAPLGAAGKLIQARDNPLFLNTLPSLNKAMSDQNAQPSLETVVKDVENIKSELSSVRQEIGSQKTMLESIASKVGADKPKDQQPPMGAAGNEQGTKMVVPKDLKDNEFVKAILEQKKTSETKLAEIEKKIAADKEAQAAAQRKAHATSIVEKMILFKQIKVDDKASKIEEFMKLTGEDGKLKDLEVLDNYLKATIDAVPKEEVILGAAGNGNVFEFHGDQSTSNISNSEIMGYRN